MISDVDLLSIEISVRDHLGEATARLWTQADMHRKINDEYGKLCRIAVSYDSGHFRTQKTYTLTAGTNYVALPRWCTALRYFEVYNGTDWFPIYPEGEHKLYKYLRTAGATQYPRFCRFEGNTLYIEPGISGITQLRIYYDRLPAPMVYGAAAAGAATTITFPSTASVHDDIYIGDDIQTLSGTGSGQLNTITDYVGSTKVATVTTWTTNPDTSTYFSTLLAHPINGYPDLVAYGTAIRCLVKRRDMDLITYLRDMYREELMSFESDMAPRHSAMSRHVNYTEEDSEIFWG